MIRFCPSVTSFVVYARRCEKCCLFRVCDYIFKRCIDCGVPEPRTETRIAGGGGIVLRNTRQCEPRSEVGILSWLLMSFRSSRKRERDKCPRKSTNRTFIVSTGEPDYRQYRPADFETCHWDGYACWQRCHSPSWNYHRTYNVCFPKRRELFNWLYLYIEK